MLEELCGSEFAAKVERLCSKRAAGNQHRDAGVWQRLKKTEKESGKQNRQN